MKIVCIPVGESRGLLSPVHPELPGAPHLVLVDVETLAFRMVPNTEEISKTLKNPQDRFIFQIIGVRHLQGRPISYVHYHLPFALGSRIPVGLLNENPFIPQFEKLAGIQVTEGVQSIFSSRASHSVAQNLGVLQGSPVLVMETLYFDTHGQPIEFVKAQYREEFRYNIRVTRRKMGIALATPVL